MIKYYNQEWLIIYWNMFTLFIFILTLSFIEHVSKESNYQQVILAHVMAWRQAFTQCLLSSLTDIYMAKRRWIKKCRKSLWFVVYWINTPTICWWATRAYVGCKYCPCHWYLLLTKYCMQSGNDKNLVDEVYPINKGTFLLCFLCCDYVIMSWRIHVMHSRLIFRVAFLPLRQAYEKINQMHHLLS